VQSWGRSTAAKHHSETLIRHSGEIDCTADAERSYLATGYGRSYGDSCLNDGGNILNTTGLNRILSFDSETGIIHCEAGVRFDQILQLIVPEGWFLPVTPGTKFVSVAGAVANDVHGKNHHVAGSFGNHVSKVRLIRSDGTLLCSRHENAELFYATIGGLGLTGVIVEVEFRLKKIESAQIDVIKTPFYSLREFVTLSRRNLSSEYTVAWLDSSVPGCRGIFFAGTHAPKNESSELKAKTPSQFRVPRIWHWNLLSPALVMVFNKSYFLRHRLGLKKQRQGYEPFFYPLDSIRDWNRLYGRQGFFQFQCVIPVGEEAALEEILRLVQSQGSSSFLSVLKRFGEIRSEGMLSFPRPGTTLALDFAATEENRELSMTLEKIAVASGGALYPAKDSHMSGETFRHSFPQLNRFIPHKDPKLSSSFWRRVTGEH